MTLEELIEREKKNCKYIQTDNNHLHWFLERDLTEWVQKIDHNGEVIQLKVTKTLLYIKYLMVKR